MPDSGQHQYQTPDLLGLWGEEDGISSVKIVSYKSDLFLMVEHLIPSSNNIVCGVLVSPH